MAKVQGKKTAAGARKGVASKVAAGVKKAVASVKKRADNRKSPEKTAKAPAKPASKPAPKVAAKAAPKPAPKTSAKAAKPVAKAAAKVAKNAKTAAKAIKAAPAKAGKSSAANLKSAGKAVAKAAKPVTSAVKSAVKAVTKSVVKATGKGAPKAPKTSAIQAVERPSKSKPVAEPAPPKAAVPAAAPAANTPPAKPAAAAGPAPKAPAPKITAAPVAVAPAQTAPPAVAAPKAPAAAEKRTRRPRLRLTSTGTAVAAWFAQPGEKPRPSSFIPAPPRAEAPSLVAAPPASSDRLVRKEDVDESAVRTVPVRVDIEQGGGRIYLGVNPQEVSLRVGEGIEWDFRYLGGADVSIDEVVIELDQPAPFPQSVFRSRRPGTARPHRQLSGAAQAAAAGKRVSYTIRAFNMFKTEMSSTRVVVLVMP